MMDSEGRLSGEGLEKEDARQLFQRLFEAQERERNAIGRELHDELGGGLTILKLCLDHLMKEPGNEVWREQIVQTIDEMVRKVRSLSHTLYPVAVEHTGLLEAVQDYLKSYQQRTGIQVSFVHRGMSRRLPFQIEATAYRIIQEALTNVAKHAAASTAHVTIQRRSGTVRLLVKDSGKGFDVARIDPSGTGIIGMRDRALLAGGSLEVASSPGRGTRIVCTLPVNGPLAAPNSAVFPSPPAA